MPRRCVLELYGIKKNKQGDSTNPVPKVRSLRTILTNSQLPRLVRIRLRGPGGHLTADPLLQLASRLRR